MQEKGERQGVGPDDSRMNRSIELLLSRDVESSSGFGLCEVTRKPSTGTISGPAHGLTSKPRGAPPLLSQKKIYN